VSERIIMSKYGYGKTAKFYEDLIKETIEEKDKEIDDLKNRLENEVATCLLRDKEIERLREQNNDLRKYIKENAWYDYRDNEEVITIPKEKLLDILEGSDKE